MAATATDFRSSQAPQRCSEPVGAVARPVLVITGDRQPREVAWRCLAGAGGPFMTFVRELGRTHTKLGKGSYDTGAPYGVGFAAVASFGFWPGDQNVREPAFYSYTAPEQEGLTEHSLSPEGASWLPEGGSALLTYEEVRNSSSPTKTLLESMESAYRAGAKSAGWDIEALRTHSPTREAAKLGRGD